MYCKKAEHNSGPRVAFVFGDIYYANRESDRASNLQTGAANHAGRAGKKHSIAFVGPGPKPRLDGRFG